MIAPTSLPARFADYTEISDPLRLPAQPVASVFVPTYLHEPYLASCIESIAGQVADFPFEIVIAEDCSADATRDVAIDLQRKYPHLVRVVFTPENKGGSLNSAFGLCFCRGEFVAVCEGDDFWIDEHKLARQVAALRRWPTVDLAFTRGYALPQDGSRFIEWDYGEEERIIQPQELFSGFGRLAPTASLLFRAEVLRNVPALFENTPSADFVVILAGSIRGGVYYEPRETICYRVGHATSFTAWSVQAPRREQMAFLRLAIRLLTAACDYYGLPRRYVSHRLNDQRLSLARLQMADGAWIGALGTLFRIGPSFLAKGAWKRLTGRRSGGQPSSSRR